MESRAVFVFNFQPQKAKVVPTPVNFTITPDTLQNSREVSQPCHVVTSYYFTESKKNKTSFLFLEEFTAKVSNQRPFRCHQLCDQPAADRGGGGGELRGSHQEY